MKKRKKPFTEEDCCRGMFDDVPDGKETNEGFVAIVPMRNLDTPYKKPDYQLFRLGTGFGCSPTLSGRACYGRLCVNGARVRFEREDLLGIANEEATKYAEELEKEWQQKKNELEM